MQYYEEFRQLANILNNQTREAFHPDCRGEIPDRGRFSTSHPGCRGEIPDKERFFCIPSGLPGRNHGQGTIFLHSIRATGEKSGTGHSNYTLCRYFRQKVTEVYRKTRSKHRFSVPSGHKTAKKLPKCLPEHNPTGTRQDIFQHGPQQAHRGTFPKKKDLTGTSQSVRAFRSRSHSLA